MPNITGHFTGKCVVQTNCSLHDTPDHEMSLMEVRGPQSTSDNNWKDATVNYWVVNDVTRGNGTQRGYFVNEHPNGDRDCGSFEGKMATSANGQSTMEGMWKYTHGTGMFSGISGGGKFNGRLTSPTEVDMSWEGNYQLAAGIRAA